MSQYVENNLRPSYDQVIVEIADYVLNYQINNPNAYEIARLCLLDALGCGMLALNFIECTKLLGPIVPNAILSCGARVPGTSYELDPVQAAFNIGTMIRWLDFNDTWLAAEWGHPSDNLGAILAVADYVGRNNLSKTSITMRDVLEMMIKAYEIQGCLALKNSFNSVGLDHVILVKLASSAVAAKLLGANRDQLLCTLSNVLVDGQSLRTYRHAPNAGTRKSWAAGDATARAVRLALITMTGEMGYPSALTVPKWGFYDASFAGKQFEIARPYTSYVIENILFKIAYPAEFHAQTAVECAIKLHSLVKERLEEISKIEIKTHASAIRIISKQGPLYNPADRDHCLQYMIAVSLLHGNLAAEHYADLVATNPVIDRLRATMHVVEDLDFSRDYLDPEKRSIANSIQIFFNDGSCTDLVTVEYPLGHNRRRAEGLPLLLEKFKNNLRTRFSRGRATGIFDIMNDKKHLENMLLIDFMTLWQV
ncbi:MAG: 2-methylcitrate dehydratase [Legionellales bacterium RIFCSPHIGHO2_12_FULL_42_9]|nr:MAG: 2-methylcitrate dehydratase [Legionellales bacterium RIFCSPHIGHO2_12_FULL_42_9]